MPHSEKIFTQKEITCPFCSLLCDDLEVSNKNGKIVFDKKTCSKAYQLFRQNDPIIPSHINGKASSLEDTVKYASNILKSARQPIISGLGTDVAGCKASIQLAEKCGAIIDHSHGESLIKNIAVLQSSGWIMTTLAEVKNRADLVIFLCTDTVANFPRFFERFIWNQPSLSGLKKNQRDIVFIGDRLNIKPGFSPDGKPPMLIKCKPDETCEIMTVLRALNKGAKINSNKLSSTTFKSLQKLNQKLQSAKYGVFIWEPGRLSFAQSELTIQTTCDLIKDLNQASRFSGLSLGGNNGGASLINICAWQSGYPIRVNFSHGSPVYNPSKFSTENLIHNNETDAILWISSFDNRLEPPGSGIPTIVIGRPSTAIAKSADVFIPVATPGLDHKGNLFRTDSVVCMPLMQLRSKQLPSTKEIIDMMIREF